MAGRPVRLRRPAGPAALRPHPGARPRHRRRRRPTSCSTCSPATARTCAIGPTGSGAGSWRSSSAGGLPDGLVLTPATTDPAVARTLDARPHRHRSGGRGRQAARPALPARACAGWQKLRTRITAEAVIGGVTGPVDAPQELILGRPDDTGRLRIVGRTTAAALTHRRAARLAPRGARPRLARTPARAPLGRTPDRLHPRPPRPRRRGVRRPRPRRPPLAPSRAVRPRRGTTCRRATSRRGRCRRPRSGSAGRPTAPPAAGSATREPAGSYYLPRRVLTAPRTSAATPPTAQPATAHTASPTTNAAASPARVTANQRQTASGSPSMRLTRASSRSEGLAQVLCREWCAGGVGGPSFRSAR